MRTRKFKRKHTKNKKKTTINTKRNTRRVHKLKGGAGFELYEKKSKLLRHDLPRERPRPLSSDEQSDLNFISEYLGQGFFGVIFNALPGHLGTHAQREIFLLIRQLNLYTSLEEMLEEIELDIFLQSLRSNPDLHRASLFEMSFNLCQRIQHKLKNYCETKYVELREESERLRLDHAAIMNTIIGGLIDDPPHILGSAFLNHHISGIARLITTNPTFTEEYYQAMRKYLIEAALEEHRRFTRVENYDFQPHLNADNVERVNPGLMRLTQFQEQLQARAAEARAAAPTRRASIRLYATSTQCEYRGHYAKR